MREAHSIEDSEPAIPEQLQTVIDSVCRHVSSAVDQNVTNGSCGRRNTGDARREVRRPYPFLLTLVPVDEQGETLQGNTFTVVGKNLSSRGIGFFHQDPIPYRRVVVHLEGVAGKQVRALVELTWCRFTRHGWYDSGGRFLDLSPTPLAMSAATG